MIYYISHIKDSIGQNYLGIKIDKQNIELFLKKLKEHLKDDYDQFIENQQKRDGSNYHLTVINVMDYNKLSKELGISNFVNSLDKIFSYPIDDLKMLGIGTAQKNENKTFFIVCDSDKLNAVRKRYNLSDHDFHITIGFKYKDVFGVRKNQTMNFESPLKSIILKKYEEYKNWDFIKNIKNFNLDKNLEIIPIDIKENYIVFQLGDYIINVGYMDDTNELRILVEYRTNEKHNRMPMPKILDILKN
jgi:hypothetical protein